MKLMHTFKSYLPETKCVTNARRRRQRHNPYVSIILACDTKSSEMLFINATNIYPSNKIDFFPNTLQLKYCAERLSQSMSFFTIASDLGLLRIEL